MLRLMSLADAVARRRPVPDGEGEPGLVPDLGRVRRDKRLVKLRHVDIACTGVRVQSAARALT